MYYENTMRWKKKLKILKILYNIVHKKKMETYLVSCKKNTANGKLSSEKLNKID